MEAMQRLYEAGVVPVVVLDRAEDAVPAARALLAGGIDVMEITFRTEAAREAIALVAARCPRMLVGAGTVITPEQCREAVEAGAQFIVSPGFDARVVSWCTDRNIPVTPGCVTPSEITQALELGLRVLKFFPAGVYGGLGAMKALSAPFGGVKFIPTGGVNEQNLEDYLRAPYVFAVGGSWVCPRKEIREGRWEAITQLCRRARSVVLGYEVMHLGINCAHEEESRALGQELKRIFGFPVKPGSSSDFVTPALEVMKSPYLGTRGHVAIGTNRIRTAIRDLAEKGCEVDPSTAKYRGEELIAIYLRQELGGFAIHLLQK